MTKRFIDRQWYRKNFTLSDMVGHPWTESNQTEREVEFIQKALILNGDEKILDLGCGFGRHSLELARQGFEVVGVDISSELIAQAKAQAKLIGSNIDFICADFRDLSFRSEFDVVLNICDGAIGYLETDEENYKMFKLIAQALKTGGKNLMHIPNTEYARKKLPRKFWHEGNEMLELNELDWDEVNKNMFRTVYSIKYGEVFQALKPPKHSCLRLYSLEELAALITPLNMKILGTYRDFSGKSAASDDSEYLIVITSKRECPSNKS